MTTVIGQPLSKVCALRSAVLVMSDMEERRIYMLST